MNSWAHISDDGRYRYILGRLWSDDDLGLVLNWVMLNPSTADAKIDDPTIRRCIGFSRLWGYCGMRVVNLYALRATQPADLWRSDDPVGPENDDILRWIAHHTETPVIAAWGANARPERVAHVINILGPRNLDCLGVTKQGAPKHPLYLPANTQHIPYPITERARS